MVHIVNIYSIWEYTVEYSFIAFKNIGIEPGIQFILHCLSTEHSLKSPFFCSQLLLFSVFDFFQNFVYLLVLIDNFA